MFSNHVLRSSTAFTLISALLFPTLAEAGRTKNSKDMLGLESTGPKVCKRMGEGPASDIEKPKNRTVLPPKKRILLDLVPETPSVPPPAPSTSSEDVDMEDTQVVPTQAPAELLVLPNETLRQIFSHLGTTDLLLVRWANHRIRDVVCDIMHQATHHSSSPEKYPLSPNTLLEYKRNPIVFRFLARHHNPEPEIQIAALKSIRQDLDAIYPRPRNTVFWGLSEWILDPALNPAPLLDDLRQAQKAIRYLIYPPDRFISERSANIAERIINHPQNRDDKFIDYQEAIHVNYMAAREQETPEKRHAYNRRVLQLYKEIEGIPSSSFMSSAFYQPELRIAEIHYEVGLYEKDPKVKLDFFLQSARLYDQEELKARDLGKNYPYYPLRRKGAGAVYYEAGLCAEDAQTKYDYFSRSAAYYDPNLKFMHSAIGLQNAARSFVLAGRYAADLDNRLKHYRRALKLMSCKSYRLITPPQPDPFLDTPSFMPNPGLLLYRHSRYAPPYEIPVNCGDASKYVTEEPANYKRATEMAECIIDRTYNPSPSLSDLRKAARLNLKAAKASESIDDKRSYFQRATTLHNEIMDPEINPSPSPSDDYFAEDLNDFAAQLETNPKE